MADKPHPNQIGQAPSKPTSVDRPNPSPEADALGQIADMLSKELAPSIVVDDPTNLEDQAPEPAEAQEKHTPLVAEEEVGEPAAETEDEEPDLLEIVRSLRAEIAQLSKRPAVPQAPPQPEPEPEPEPIQLNLTDEEIAEAQYDAGKLRKLLEKVVLSTREQVLRGIPNVVASTVARQTSITNAITTFYENNPQLKEHMDYTGYVYNQVEGEHPDWNLQQVLEETSIRAHHNLGLKVVAVKREQERKDAGKGQKPAFARKPSGAGSRQGVQDTRTEMQKDIDAMLSSSR